MKVKCDYCGNYIKDTDAVCPSCGAPNDHMQRSASGVPKTIAELQNFCAAKKLPLAKMRFFLGQDYREPKAFGIYQDDEGMFVVYKNKADGSRAIRYRGEDEAYAVNEIYQKLRSEVDLQRQRVNRSTASSRSRNSGGKSLVWIIFVILLVINLLLSVGSHIRSRNNHNGYYQYNGSYYYNQNDTWYTYDDDYDWIPAVVDTELEENYSDYYSSSDYSSSYDVEDFSDSSYYVAPSYNSDWDDDDDWDWGDSDWDSGGTDWDSDW